jgi:NhaP-type Na+/H+ or K+/H+ antiporter
VTEILLMFGLVAVVLIVSALASGLVERAPISFPIIFLGLGYLLGERGLGLLHVSSHDPALEAIAVITLALVLFLDAVKLQFDEGRRAWLAPVLILGPGTLLVIALIAGAANWLLGFAPLTALLIGAILASTDPVVLRDVVRNVHVPRAVRRTLSIEAGLNDIVVLPIVIIVSAVLVGRVGTGGQLAGFLLSLFIVGPLVGFAVGGAGSWLMNWVDARTPIRREYQALYGIGLVLAAYAAGTAVGGDGFLAAFAAGAAVVVLNTELCDCFTEYGETTSEMAMLLAFVLFGALLSSIYDLAPLLPSLALAAIVLFVIRPLAIELVLLRASVSREARLFMGWFGPRGLNSLLFALLVVRDQVPNAELLLAVTGIVVTVSVVLHGVTATPLSNWYGRVAEQRVLAEERESTAGGLFLSSADGIRRLTPSELAEQVAGPNPPLVLDVRSHASYDPAGWQIPESVRVEPDQVGQWASTATRDRLVVAYCT